MGFSFLKIAFATPGQLSEEQELELLKKWQTTGDKTTYNQLMLSLRPLVEKMIVDAMPSGKDVSSSILRMKVHAKMPQILTEFEADRGNKLKTFIISKLKGELRNTVSENVGGAYVPRNQHSDLQKFEQAIRSAEMEFGNRYTEDQVRGFYPQVGVANDFDRIKQYYKKNYNADAVFGGDENVTFKDQFTSGNSISKDDIYNDIFEEEMEEQVKDRFSPQEKLIIDRLTKNGESLTQVALSVGVSTGEVRKIIRRWYELQQNA